MQNQLAETIRPFIRAAFSLQLKRRRYNDDIRLVHYRPVLLRSGFGQREGVHEPLTAVWIGNTTCGSPRKRTPLSTEPLPSETIRAIEFTRSTPGGQNPEDLGFPSASS